MNKDNNFENNLKKLESIVEKLENGEVVESGTHDELLMNKSVYSNLWDVQTGKAKKT